MNYSDTTVIIPVKDEPAVGAVARQVLKELKGCKVIVIYKDDADRENVDFADKNMALMKQKGNGKGVACMQAAKRVNTRILCLIDGDATYEAKDLKKAIALVRGGADLAIGNRLNNLDREAMPAFIEFGNRVITQTSNLLYGLMLTDSQSGLRAIRKEAFDRLHLTEEFFGIETEMNVMAIKNCFKVVETPISYHKRIGNSKQVKMLDGVKLLLTDFKFLFRGPQE
ncbi:MAG TPA: glycosyltransferase family 2 protein [Candidatus Baltobacteraceae bacterium]|nr:glycosyltransferase family 2 protein [Candidatus Baltobacteraceae bacterium]HVC58427.1 glycosyltransferase family 2 protein [Candidatus Acidoferrales bacterium]